MSCTKILRHPQLNAWRMELTTVQENFSCKTIFFKIDQLIADNPKSSKQTFHLSQCHIYVTQMSHKCVGPENEVYVEVFR